MKPQQQQQQHPQCIVEETNTQSKVVGGGGGYICRQSTSTRWTPTSDQIRILKELYNNHGVRSPDSDQIQRISSRLRQYGKIEGKNVFYWFQNHKARERQKKRSISDNHSIPIPIQRPSSLPLKPDDLPPLHLLHHPHPTYPNLNGFCASGFACGPMEKGLKECCISAGGVVEKGGGNGSSSSSSFRWAAVDPYSYAVLSRRNRIEVMKEGEDIEEEEEEEESGTVETLPLFPVHSEEQQMSGVSSSSSSSCMPKSPESGCCNYNYHSSSSSSSSFSRASLELRLNSFSSI